MALLATLGSARTAAVKDPESGDVVWSAHELPDGRLQPHEGSRQPLTPARAQLIATALNLWAEAALLSTGGRDATAAAAKALNGGKR